MPPDVALRLDNVTFTGWQRVRIIRGIEQLAGTFELEMVDKWSLDGSQRQIRDGMACQVLVAGQPVITGWVDEIAGEYGATSHTLRVRGRDKAGDLVDCAAVHAAQEWVGRDLAQIAASLAAPFGVGVRVETDIGGPFRYAHAEPGETVHELLDRGARMRGVLIVSDAATGDIVLTRTGQNHAATPLRLGENILSGSATRSQRERFSVYRAVGQQRESEGVSPQMAATSAASVRDPGITRYRPTVVSAGEAANIGDCNTRARWERSIRAAQGQRAVLTVAGWLDGFEPWTPNTRVSITDHWLGLSGEYLIARVEYSIDDDAGAIAALTVVPPGAYDVLAEKETNPTTAVAGTGAEAEAGSDRGVVFGSGLTLSREAVQ